MFKKQRPNYFVTVQGSKVTGYQVSLHIHRSILEQFHTGTRVIMGERLKYCWGSPEDIRFSYFFFLPRYGKRTIFFENYSDAEKSATKINTEIADIINGLSDSPPINVQLLPFLTFSKQEDFWKKIWKILK